MNERSDNNVVSRFVNESRIATPATRQIIEKQIASLVESLKVGNGLVAVLVIRTSLSFSIIWLTLADEPDTNRPPTKSINNENRLTSFEASMKPNTHENATVKDKRNLSNSKYAFTFTLSIAIFSAIFTATKC